jgi:hypothetical protein
MNYRTQKEYIENRINEILLISDKATRFGQLYAFEDELKKTKAQYGGHYQGVGKACTDGIQLTIQIQYGGL